MLKDLELSGRLAADMDPQLLQFLTEKVDSFVKWDLLRFFHENPHTTDTAQNIARYAGRNPELVRADLAALALCVEDTLLALRGEPLEEEDQPAPEIHPTQRARVEEYLQHALETHRQRLGV